MNEGSKCHTAEKDMKICTQPEFFSDFDFTTAYKGICCMHICGEQSCLHIILCSLNIRTFTYSLVEMSWTRVHNYIKRKDISLRVS